MINRNFVDTKELIVLRIQFLKDRKCLRNKFSRFSRIFAKFTKLNPSEKFFFVFQNQQKFLATLDASINDDYVKNILQDIKQYKQREYRKKKANLFIMSAPFGLLLGIQSRIVFYIQIIVFEISKNLGKSSLIHILQAEEHTQGKMKIYKTLIKLRFAKINPRKKSTSSQPVV